MVKARPKTPAVSAAEKDEKAAEQASAAAAAAAEAEATAAAAVVACPYLLSFDALNRIFGSKCAVSASSTTASEEAEPSAAAAEVKTTAQKFLLLQQALGVQHFDANPRTAAWVDFCFGVLCFARNEDGDDRESDGHSRSAVDQSDDEKALLLLTIANDIFQFATAPITPASDNSSNSAAEDLPSVELCYDRFRERVREVSTTVGPVEEDEQLQQNQQHDVASPNAPPPPLAPRKPTLSTAEVARFVAFMSATFFRHLAAYQFVFRHARPSVTREVDVVVETPFPPPPLVHATQLLMLDE